MSKSALAVAVALAALALDLSAAAAAPKGGRQAQRPDAGVFAQAPDRPERARRARPRIIVRPATAPATGIYPSPLPYNYPGPNAVRECDSRLVEEHRPSGTVIVPRMWCWWSRQ